VSRVGELADRMEVRADMFAVMARVAERRGDLATAMHLHGRACGRHARLAQLWSREAVRRSAISMRLANAGLICAIASAALMIVSILGKR